MRTTTDKTTFSFKELKINKNKINNLKNNNKMKHKVNTVIVEKRVDGGLTFHLPMGMTGKEFEDWKSNNKKLINNIKNN